MNQLELSLSSNGNSLPAPSVSRGAERLLDLLRWYGQRFRRIHPFQSDIAEHLKLTSRQIRRYIRELRSLGILAAVRKFGRQAAEYIFSDEWLAKQNVRSKSGRRPVYDRSASGPDGPYPYSLIEVVSVPSNPAPAPTPPPEPMAAAASPPSTSGESAKAPPPQSVGLSNNEFRLIQKRTAELGMGMPSRRLAAKVRGLFPTIPIENVLPLLVRFDGQQQVGLWNAKTEDDFRNEARMQLSGLKKGPGISKIARAEAEAQEFNQMVAELRRRRESAG